LDQDVGGDAASSGALLPELQRWPAQRLSSHTASAGEAIGGTTGGMTAVIGGTTGGTTAVIVARRLAPQ